LALRCDLFPREFCQELSKLGEVEPPPGFQGAIQIVETALGKSIDELFASFNNEPTCTDLLGQVHSAVLRSGEPVSVKVQRPGLKPTIHADLVMIRVLLRAFSFGGLLGRARVGDVYEQFRRHTLQSLSYVTQAHHAERLAAQSQDNPHECIPRVYWSHTTEDVLTLETLDGIALSDVMQVWTNMHDPVTMEIFAHQGVNPQDAARNILVNALNQVFNQRYFYCRPHPANLIIMQGNAIGYMDFARVARTNQGFARYRFDLLSALRSGDVDSICEIILEFLVLPFDVDLTQLALRLESRISSGLDDREKPNLPAHEHRLVDLIASIMGDLGRFGVSVPDTLLAYCALFDAVDSIVLRIAPELELKSELAAFFRETLTRRVQEEFRFSSLGELVLEYEEFLVTLPRRFRESMRLVRRTQSPVVRTVNQWGLRGWKFMRALTTFLIAGVFVAWVGNVFCPQRLPLRLPGGSSSGLLGCLAVLLVARRVFGIRYDHSAMGRLQVRLPE